MAIREALAFDDVSLVPVYTEVRSRTDPDISTEIAGMKLRIPMISSPMDTITESKMAIAMGMAGGMGIIHRFMSAADQVENLRAVRSARDKSGIFIPVVPAIGIGLEELGRLREILDSVVPDSILIDVANGHSSYMKEMIQMVQGIAPDLKIIAGSIATGEGFRFLAELGVSACRVGISGGSICSTRIKTGHGVPTFQSVCDAYGVKTAKDDWMGYRQYPNVAIIADGGIRYPADFVKALAAGADAVMCGRIFAATDETPGEVITMNDSCAIDPGFYIGVPGNAGIKAKTYRGAASAEIQLDKRGGMRPDTCAEGVSTTIACAGPVASVLNEFCGGLRSGMTYANARNLADLRQNAQFVRVTSNGNNEGHAFGTRKE